MQFSSISWLLIASSPYLLLPTKLIIDFPPTWADEGVVLFRAWHWPHWSPQTPPSAPAPKTPPPNLYWLFWLWWRQTATSPCQHVASRGYFCDLRLTCAFAFAQTKRHIAKKSRMEFFYFLTGEWSICTLHKCHRDIPIFLINSYGNSITVQGDSEATSVLRRFGTALTFSRSFSPPFLF